MKSDTTEGGGKTLVVVIARQRDRCQGCQGNQTVVPTVFLPDGSTRSGTPESCGDCGGTGYR